jgi:hypothetical protein
MTTEELNESIEAEVRDLCFNIKISVNSMADSFNRAMEQVEQAARSAEEFAGYKS